MALLTGAKTRLGLFGHAARLVGSFLRGAPAVVAATDTVYLAVADARVTLLVGVDAVVTFASATDV